MTSNIKNNIITTNLAQRSGLFGSSNGLPKLLVKWAAQTVDKKGSLRTFITNADNELDSSFQEMKKSSNKTEGNNKRSAVYRRGRSTFDLHNREPDRKSFNFRTLPARFPDLLSLDPETKRRLSVNKGQSGNKQDSADWKRPSSGKGPVEQNKLQAKIHTRLEKRSESEKPVVRSGTASTEKSNDSKVFEHYDTFMERYNEASKIRGDTKPTVGTADQKQRSAEGTTIQNTTVKVSNKDFTARGSTSKFISPTSSRTSMDHDFMPRAQFTMKQRATKFREFHLLPVDDATKKLIAYRNPQTDDENRTERPEIDKFSLLPEYLKPQIVPQAPRVESKPIKRPIFEKEEKFGTKWYGRTTPQYRMPVTVNFENSQAFKDERHKFDMLTLLPEFMQPQGTTMSTAGVEDEEEYGADKYEKSETFKEEKTAADDDTEDPTSGSKGKQQKRPIPTALSILAAGLGIYMIRESVPRP